MKEKRNSRREGIQLLSPSLQRGLQQHDNQMEEKRSFLHIKRPPPPPPPSSRPIVFNFDVFGETKYRESQVATTTASDGSSSPQYSRSSVKLVSHHSLHHYHSHPNFSSIDSTHSLNRSGITSTSHTERLTSSSSINSFYSTPLPPPRTSMMSTTSTIRPPVQVIMSGWFQRRRGRVIKRWKLQYVVLKEDHQMCFYTNEDTINGKLEGRFEVLRITYQSHQNTVFQVIGIGRDKTPHKEELRLVDQGMWKSWIVAFRRYFDASSLELAIERMPELLLLPREEEEDDGEEDSDFAQQVEEMVLRPFTYEQLDDDDNKRIQLRLLDEGIYQRKTIMLDIEQFVFDQETTNQVDESGVECPMIERTSQNQVPILERSGSESLLSSRGTTSMFG